MWAHSLHETAAPGHKGEAEVAMLSQKAKYGLRALVELARADETQLSAGELATRAEAPRKFLEAILLELSRNQIVVSRRGKFGGYTLARDAAAISFAEVIRIIDGPLALAPCVSPRLGFRKCADCSDLDTCTLREALRRARDATADVLERYSLADAAKAVPSAIMAS
jgi:Rrf2 family protein